MHGENPGVRLLNILFRIPHIIFLFSLERIGSSFFRSFLPLRLLEWRAMHIIVFYFVCFGFVFYVAFCIYQHVPSFVIVDFGRLFQSSREYSKIHLYIYVIVSGDS